MKELVVMYPGRPERSPAGASSMLMWSLLLALASAACAALPAGITGDGCRTDADCVLGVCNPDGLCAPRCTDNGHCPEGATCENNVCVGQLVPPDAGVTFIGDGGAPNLEDGGASSRDGGGPGRDGGPTDGGTLADGGTQGDGGGSDGGRVDGGRAESCRERGARRACGSSLGTCRLGEQECSGEFWGPCVGAVGPSAEQCDGEDHDCDGIPNNPVGGCDCSTGDTRACYNGPADTRGVGTCRDGTQTCAAGRWGDCVGAVTPESGRCDVLSCTGGANPGCTCVPNESRACYDGRAEDVGRGLCRAGTQRCVTTPTSAVFGACEGQTLPAPERCDGMDHDCSGTADDRPAPDVCECRNGATRGCYDGPPETRGVGTCRDGTQTCADGRWGSCQGAVKPIPGACLEASCAGTPNPGCACVPGHTRGCYSGAMGTLDVGVCRAGTQTCVRGSAGAVQWGPCVGERVPEAEQCDGLDHDCNRTLNDRPGGCDCQTGQTRPCYDGPADTRGVGTCRDGMQACTDGRWGSCTGQTAPLPNRCDVDSCAGGPNPGCLCTVGDARSCYSGPPAQVGVGICRAGTQRCISFETGGVGWGTCLGEQLPEPEQCDGLDHDCNTRLDDRATPACECRNGQSRPCYNGPAGTSGVGTCRDGSQICVDGRWGSCSGAVEPRTGVCGEASCTGPNDPNPGCACIVGRTRGCYDGPPNTQGVGLCGGGMQTCAAVPSGSAWGACQGQRLPATERCDNQDHDCNGVPNDRPGGCVCVAGQSQSCYSGPSGTAGVGTCRAGSQSCVLNGAGGFEWGACTGEVVPQPGNCAVASCVGPNTPNPNCACINGRTQSCYTGTPATSVNFGICAAGSQTCVSGNWATCTGQTLPDTADLCVPPGAAYSSYRSSDRTCSGVLERHNPVANPTMNAGSGQTLSPLPSGFVRGLVVEPLDTVTFVGAATDQDAQTSFSYRWRLLSAPQNNTAGLSGAPGATPNDYSTQQSPTLFAQLAGDYVVAVRATDATGCQSDEVQLLMRVKPHSAIHVQVTWDKSVDLDLQMVQGSMTGITFNATACYWGTPDPDWGVVDPHLDIDDLAGCNPENINFGAIGGTRPPLNSAYGVWVHYYCNRRGHRSSATNPAAVCYEPAQVTGPVTATVKVFVDGQLAKIDQTTIDAVFTQALTQTQTWKPVNIRYDQSGVWRVTRGTEPLGTASASACTSASSVNCVCGGSMITNPNDPYCGTTGAACRQRFP